MPGTASVGAHVFCDDGDFLFFTDEGQFFGDDLSDDSLHSISNFQVFYASSIATGALS